MDSLVAARKKLMKASSTNQLNVLMTPTKKPAADFANSPSFKLRNIHQQKTELKPFLEKKEKKKLFADSGPFVLPGLTKSKSTKNVLLSSTDVLRLRAKKF